MRNLTPLVEPKIIAITGLKHDLSSLGYTILRNIQKGSSYITGSAKHFQGKIYPVQQGIEYISGLKCYPTLGKLPEVPDVVLICDEHPKLMDLLRDCVRRKVGGVVLYTKQFMSGTEAERIMQFSAKNSLPILGWNSAGVIRPFHSYNATITSSIPEAGSVLLITQSSGILQALASRPANEAVGFSAVVGVGSEGSLSIADVIEWGLSDTQTQVIAIVAEQMRFGKEFIKIAKRASKKKPVVFFKVGTTDVGEPLIEEHLGRRPTDVCLYYEACSYAGIILTDTLESFVDELRVLTLLPQLKGDVAVLTNSESLGIMAADELHRSGLKLAKLKSLTTKALHTLINHTHNPLMIGRTASLDVYEKAAHYLMSDDNVGGLVVIYTPQSSVDTESIAKVLAKTKQFHPSKPLLSAFVGSSKSGRDASVLKAECIPDFLDVRRLARVLSSINQKK